MKFVAQLKTNKINYNIIIINYCKVFYLIEIILLLYVILSSRAQNI